MTFISCDDARSQLDGLLNRVDQDGSKISRGVEEQVIDIDTAVGSGGLSTAGDVNNAISLVGDNIVGLVPNYLDRNANTGPALAKWDSDFGEFKDYLANCKQAKLSKMINLLDLGIELPLLGNSLDLAETGLSSLRRGISGMTSFPLSYLKSKKKSILESISNSIISLGGLLEFDLANPLDGLEQTLATTMGNAIHEIEYVFACVEAMKCGDVSDYKASYNDIMDELPLSPAYKEKTGSNPAPQPSYSLDLDSIYSQTIANSTQISNLTKVKNSYTENMNYGRTLTSNY